MNQPKWAKKFKENLMILSMPEINALTGYTGKGSDGKLQVSNPVWEDKMQVHEGEYVVKSADVEKHGGPKGVEKKLGIKPAPNVIPFCKGGMVRKFLTGGPVVGSSYYNSDWYQKQNDPSKMTVNLLNGQVQNATQQKLLEGGATPNTVTTTGIASTAPFATAPVPAPVVPSLTTTEHYGSQWTAEDQARADATKVRMARDEAQSTTTWKAPEPVVAPTERYKTIAGGSVIDTTTGKIVQMGAQDLSTNLNLNKPAPAPVTNADRVDQYGNQVDDTIAIYNEIKSGNSPMVKKLVDSAYGNLDPRLATQAMVRAMQIAQNPNMTEGAKRASIAGQMRDAGLAQAGLAGTLATQALNMAMEAIGMSATLSQNQQTFYEDARRAAKSEAWTDFEYTAQYGSDADVIAAYKTATGKDLDPASVAEIRGYAREVRSANLDATRLALGDSTYTSIQRMIEGGSSFEDVQLRFPNVTQEQFDNMSTGKKDEIYDNAMLELEADIATGLSFEDSVRWLEDIAESSDITYTDTWAKSFYKKVTEQANVVTATLKTYDDRQLELLVRPDDALTGWNLSQYTYKNLTGRAAAEQYFADMYYDGGIKITKDANGNPVVGLDPEILGGGHDVNAPNETPVALATTDATRLGLVSSSPGIFKGTDGKSYAKAEDGKWYLAPANYGDEVMGDGGYATGYIDADGKTKSLTVPAEQMSAGGYFAGKEQGFPNGAYTYVNPETNKEGWHSFTDGDTFYNGTANAPSFNRGVVLPIGIYKVKEGRFVNLSTGKVYQV